MDGRQRLIGLDLLRGIAVFAVVLLHADEGIAQPPPLWSALLSFAEFAVPFFLATAFYLAVGRMAETAKPYPLRSRVVRLLLPYLIWSALYTFYKILKYWVANKPDQLVELYHDPIALVFLGGAAFHLYFLPLLMIGSLWLPLLQSVIRRPLSPATIVLGGVASLALYGGLWASGNAFHLKSYMAFQALVPEGSGGVFYPVLRLGLVAVAWLIRCLPYVWLAIALCHPQVRHKVTRWTENHVVLWGIFFCVLNGLGGQLLPEFLFEIVRGYAALLLALALSKHLASSAWIYSLGICSFGIYLLHLIIAETLQMLIFRLMPNLIVQANFGTLLANAGLIFLTSWGLTALWMTKPSIAKVLFGS